MEILNVNECKKCEWGYHWGYFGDTLKMKLSSILNFNFAEWGYFFACF